MDNIGQIIDEKIEKYETIAKNLKEAKEKYEAAVKNDNEIIAAINSERDEKLKTIEGISGSLSSVKGENNDEVEGLVESINGEVESLADSITTKASEKIEAIKLKRIESFSKLIAEIEGVDVETVDLSDEETKDKEETKSVDDDKPLLEEEQTDELVTSEEGLVQDSVAEVSEIPVQTSVETVDSKEKTQDDTIEMVDPFGLNSNAETVVSNGTEIATTDPIQVVGVEPVEGKIEIPTEVFEVAPAVDNTEIEVPVVDKSSDAETVSTVVPEQAEVQTFGELEQQPVGEVVQEVAAPVVPEQAEVQTFGGFEQQPVGEAVKEVAAPVIPGQAEVPTFDGFEQQPVGEAVQEVAAPVIPGQAEVPTFDGFAPQPPVDEGVSDFVTPFEQSIAGQADSQEQFVPVSNVEAVPSSNVEVVPSFENENVNTLKRTI